MRRQWYGFYRPHESVVSDVGGPSRTRPEFQEECDINTIMAKYERTGVLTHARTGEPMYVDWTAQPSDLQGTLGMLAEATDAFMRLPARVRLEFENDPVRFVGFATDPSNLEQLRDWKLAPAAELPDAPREPSISPSSPSSEPQA